MVLARRGTEAFARPRPEVPGPGQESVWAYPRPPAVDPTEEHVVVELGGQVLAETRRPIRILETSHAPTYYLPREDVRWELLEATARTTFCEFKGAASYADALVGQRRVRDVCWWYDEPTAGFEAIAGHVCFYPERVDRAVVDGDVVQGVEGSFYGGWVTPRVVGPFKGGPGTLGW
jgi:uncharacterized protein (DUF427 family)